MLKKHTKQTRLIMSQKKREWWAAKRASNKEELHSRRNLDLTKMNDAAQKPTSYLRKVKIAIWLLLGAKEKYAHFFR